MPAEIGEPPCAKTARRSGKFIEIQGTAEREPFDEKMMHKMIWTAKDGIKELVAVQKKLVGKALNF